ncbi:MAG: amino acid adenylation domain-containing protein [Ignavibacteria bacterium]
MEDVSSRIDRSFQSFGDRLALCVGGRRYTYSQLAARAFAIHRLIDAIAPDDSLVGVFAADALDTYASVLAILRAGKGFVPINPTHPKERNSQIIRSAGLSVVLAPSDEQCASLKADFDSLNVVSTSSLDDAPCTDFSYPPPSAIAYVLFTSGSTGEPKGVAITRGNLNEFTEALPATGADFSEQDRVLQSFDLTFDFSIASYLVPFCFGSCVFATSPDKIKFTEIYRLLVGEKLTVAPMVPSTLNYLRPYFDEIELPDLRHSMLCGEALHDDVAAEWAKCTPNSRIFNFYGPTEATVFALVHEWQRDAHPRAAQNGVVSIGRPFGNNRAVIVDGEGKVADESIVGELCLAGPQLTPGYWNDPARNATSFFELQCKEGPIRHYRTGDLATLERDGNYYFRGRLDKQVKIQGFRIELGEIEFHARAAFGNSICVVLPYTNDSGITELHLFIEGYDGKLDPGMEQLRQRIPHYMVPNGASVIERLPLNPNGKIDSGALRALLGR